MGGESTPARLEELFDPGVRTVDLMLTTKCNLRCAYCYQRRDVPRTMRPEVLDAAIRRLVSSGLDRPRLTLYGGEPLLAAPLVRRALDRVRSWAPRRMKPDIRIVTNGTLLDERMTRLLVRRDVHVTLSFDGVPPAQDERGPGSFPILDALLRRLRKEHPRHLQTRVASKITLTSRNVPYLAASFQYFLSRGLRDVEVVPVLPDDAGWDRRSARELNLQLAGIVRVSKKEYRRSGGIPFQPFRGAAPAREDEGLLCACGSRSLLFVDVDGSLAPCAPLAPSTLPLPSAAIRRALRALGGLHVNDPDLPAALLCRERRAGRLALLAGNETERKSPGTQARRAGRPAPFVCPVALAETGGSIPGIQADFHRLVEKHRAVFRRGAGLHDPTRRGIGLTQ